MKIWINKFLFICVKKKKKSFSAKKNLYSKSLYKTKKIADRGDLRF